MKTRLIDINLDYSDISSWWEAAGHPIVDLELLPVVGVMVEDKDKKICAAFLYQTDSQLAWLEWFVANPVVNKEVRREALDVLTKRLLTEAKILGNRIVYTCIQKDSLKGLAKNNGFTETLNGASVHMKQI